MENAKIKKEIMRDNDWPVDPKEIIKSLPDQIRYLMRMGFEKIKGSEAFKFTIPVDKIRRNRNEYTQEEISHMDEKDREAIFLNTWFGFLRSIGFNSLRDNDPEKVLVFLDTIWNDRNRINQDPNLIRREYFLQQEDKYKKIAQEANYIFHEIKNLLNKGDLNKVDKARLEELSNELKSFGLRVFDGELIEVGDLVDTSKLKDLIFWGMELPEIKKYEECSQKTLSILARYTDALEFVIIFNQALDLRLKWEWKNNPEKMNKLKGFVNDWADQHENELAIENPSQT